jgi:predicted secreted protein
MANLKVGETFTIERDSNAPSTGYDWLLVKIDGPAGLINEAFRHENVPGHISGHGKKVFVFEALREGTAYIQLARVRPWEPEKAIYENVLPFVIEKADAEPAVNELLGIKAGGWTPFGKPDADAEAVFKEAFANHVGVDYKPLLAAVQTVNGKNFLFAVNATIVTKDPRDYAALVRVYKAPGEKAVVTGVTKLGHPSFAGSYGAFETAPAAVKAALEEARGVGLDFEADYVATQTVAGRNYLFAGNAKYVTLKTSAFPAFVTVYKPLEGKARITSVRAAYEA